MIKSITYQAQKFLRTYTVGKEVLVIGEGYGGSPLLFLSEIKSITTNDDSLSIRIDQNNYMTSFDECCFNQLIPVTSKLIQAVKNKFGYQEIEVALKFDFEEMLNLIITTY